VLQNDAVLCFYNLESNFDRFKILYVFIILTVWKYCIYQSAEATPRVREREMRKIQNGLGPIIFTFWNKKNYLMNKVNRYVFINELSKWERFGNEWSLPLRYFNAWSQLLCYYNEKSL